MGERVALLGETSSETTFELACKDQTIQVDVLNAKQLWEEAIPCLMK